MSFAIASYLVKYNSLPNTIRKMNRTCVATAAQKHPNTKEVLLFCFDMKNISWLFKIESV